MALSPDDALATLTEDVLLGGRLRLLQPARGFRISTDAVLLAAAVPARPGDAVLELGCGGGGALLCLSARVSGLDLTGLEREDAWVDLAGRNADLNRVAITFFTGDVAAMPAGLRALSFDHVMANPPFFRAEASVAPAGRLRDAAHREDVPLGSWVKAALARLRPGGWLTVIQRADRLPEILMALAPAAGSVSVLPLTGRDGRDAKRVIVRARKGARGPFRLLAPFVLHAGATHVEDGDDFTADAAAVLRDAAALPL